jgi:hypothetical protein
VRRLWLSRRDSLSLPFTAASADGGYRFDVQVQGQWRHRGRHRAPADAVASHVVDVVGALAARCSILAATELQYRANACLGQPVDLPQIGVRLLWASVHVHVAPRDLNDATEDLRADAVARRRMREQRLRVEQAVAYRDLLREDPTLAAAQLLVEDPTHVGQQTVDLVQELARLVATHAPGATWVATARLLEDSFGALPPKAKQYVVDRVCTALTEFTQTRSAAAELREYRFAPAGPAAEATLSVHEEGAGT